MVTASTDPTLPANTGPSSERLDIACRQDIERLMLRFYSRAFADPLIGAVFTDVARVDLQAHVPVVSDFWESALLQSRNYRRNAFVVHRQLDDHYPLLVVHFERWLEIWTATVDSLYAGPVAEHAKTQGTRIARSMARRLNARRLCVGELLEPTRLD